jgi:hypothetical protein
MTSPFLDDGKTQFAWVTEIKLFVREATNNKFWSNVRVLDNGCWHCHLATNAKGYIPFSPSGRSGGKKRLHRYLYEHLYGDVPADLLVLHTCDNRRCINPNHLYVGTAAQNTKDMLDRGRARNGGKTKVTIDIFEKMKALRARGLTNAAIGKFLGLSDETVRSYLNGTFTFPSRD